MSPITTKDLTSEFIFSFCSGLGLPYTSYSDEALEKIICYKQNNLKAASRTVDALTAYKNDITSPMKIEIMEQLVKELNAFLINGLFGIGFWGISVENGKPIRVDSMGMNISKRYDSVYSSMTEEEYNNLDRTESMVIDQEETRKFNKYILWYKTKIAETLVPHISISDEEKTPLINDCIELDVLLRDALRITTLSDHAAETLYNSAAFYQSLDKISERFSKYDFGTGTIAPPKYTTGELDPVLPTSSFPLISEYERTIN